MTADLIEPHRLVVFDTVVLSHFALADRLDVLAYLMLGQPCATTAVVIHELREGVPGHPALTAALDADWIQIFALDQPDEVRAFAQWTRRLGATVRDKGEASVFALAEKLHGLAITDDRDATRVGRAYGIHVHGTIWLLARACQAGKLTEVNAGAIVDSLRETGHRLPCTGGEFPAFGRRFGLLQD